MIVTLGVRVLQVRFGNQYFGLLVLTQHQIVFSTVVLGLSVALVVQYGPGRAPSLFAYGAFCGGCSLLFALVGVSAVFVEKLQGIVMLALDALATFFLLAGGIVSSPLWTILGRLLTLLFRHLRLH